MTCNKEKLYIEFKLYKYVMFSTVKVNFVSFNNVIFNLLSRYDCKYTYDINRKN